MAPSKKETVIDIKLTVRYHGLKATQYFSKFTSESDKTFRDDLLALRLPHPKRENTTFRSHGCVECEWKAVQSEGVLHKQIMTKSKPPYEKILQDLSISNIKVKCIYPPNNLPPKTNGVKRANPFTESQPTNPVPALPNPVWSGNHQETMRDDYNRHLCGAVLSRPPWDPGSQKRPHKQAKLNEGDISSSNPQKLPTFPTFTNLPSLPPRPEGPGKTRVFAPTVPNKTTRSISGGSRIGKGKVPLLTDPGAQGESSTPVVPKMKSAVANDDSRAPASPMAIDYLSKTNSNLALHVPGPSHSDKSDVNEPNIVAVNSRPIKQEPDDNAHFSVLQGTATLGDTPSHEKPLRTPTQNNIPEESSPESEKTKGDLLIQDILKNLKSQNLQNSGFTTTPHVHQSLQNPNNGKEQTPPTNPHSTFILSNPPHQTGNSRNDLSSFADLKESLQQLDWYSNPQMLPRLDTETMPPAAPPSTSSATTSGPLVDQSGKPSDVIRTTPPTPQTATPSQEFDSGDTADIMANRKGSRARGGESDKFTIQRLQRELYDIKREINAKAARECVVIAELKALNVPSIPAPVMIGYNPSEEMRDRLARLEHELAAERKLREEAECVISDIRRECRTPFVVPSLFDAFVDLSKLTTRALRPESPSSLATDEPVDMSISPKP